MNAIHPPGASATGPAPPRAVALDRLIRAVLDREPFIALTGEAGTGRAAVLNAAVAALAEHAIRVIRIGNALAAPLTVRRLLLQLGDAEAAGDEPEDAEHVLEALTRRLHGEEQVVIAVEAAETLQPQALSFLQLLPAIRTEGSPVLEVLFVGRDAFWALLEDEAFRPLREQLVTRIAVEPGVATRATLRAPARRPYRLATGLLVAVALIACLGFFGRGFFYRNLARPPSASAPAAERAAEDAPSAAPAAAIAAAPIAPAAATLAPATPAPATAGPATAASATAAPATPAAVPSAPPTPADPEHEARERLRREFDAFLDRSPDAAQLTETQRRLLFEEYLARHNRADR